MENSVNTHNPAFDVIVFLIASTTGAFGDLAELDLFMSIILKGVSIISFTALIIINWSTVMKILKRWTSKRNKNDNKNEDV
jgi:hypothetical protein